MSALPPEAHMLIVGINVRYVPLTEITNCQTTNRTIPS